jgi:hypothetical protein
VSVREYRELEAGTAFRRSRLVTGSASFTGGRRRGADSRPGVIIRAMQR